MHRSAVTLAALALAAASWLAVPAPVDAQVWKKIREQAEKKVETRKAKADSMAVARAGQTVDSTLAKTGRGVDVAVSKAATIADRAVEKTEQTVTDAAATLGGRDDDAEKLSADLADGRAVLPEIRFEGATDQLAAAADAHVERLAKLLETLPGSFVIEGHVDETGNAPADQALSEKRSAAVKARLAAAGVPAERLFAMGLGATRPPTDARTSRARIEIARMK